MIRGTRFLILSIALAAAFLSGAHASDDKQFQAGKAGDYAHQASDQVVVGAKAFDNADLTAEAFGKKTDLLKYGVLPVLVVIENKRDKTINLENLEVSLVGADGSHVAAMNASDVQLMGGEGHRQPRQPGVGLPIPLPKKKNPLAAPEIEGRAFSAKMLPAGDSASGFFYFEAQAEAGDTIYLSGMRDARNGKEILYFEFPLKKDDRK